MLDPIKLLEGMGGLREGVDREGVDERIEVATDRLGVDVEACGVDCNDSRDVYEDELLENWTELGVILCGYQSFGRNGCRFKDRVRILNV